MYVKIINDAVDTFPYSVRQLKQDNPNTSFPDAVSGLDLSDYGVYDVTVSTKPSAAHDKKAVSNDAPTLIDGVWTLGWTVRDLTADEIALEAKAVRRDRDELLAECDWTQMPDSPLDDSTKASWATYRTALRDITEQSGFPTDITWPTAP
tara:strand:+ start:67 stop:516 length:450 start_codon:yes stop_codon:yes gene_type:complete